MGSDIIMYVERKGRDGAWHLIMPPTSKAWIDRVWSVKSQQDDDWALIAMLDATWDMRRNYALLGVVGGCYRAGENYHVNPDLYGRGVPADADPQLAAHASADYVWTHMTAQEAHDLKWPRMFEITHDDWDLLAEARKTWTQFVLGVSLTVSPDARLVFGID
jgi:hypothetical protein